MRFEAAAPAIAIGRTGQGRRPGSAGTVISAAPLALSAESSESVQSANGGAHLATTATVAPAERLSARPQRHPSSAARAGSSNDGTMLPGTGNDQMRDATGHALCRPVPCVKARFPVFLVL